MKKGKSMKGSAPAMDPQKIGTGTAGYSDSEATKVTEAMAKTMSESKKHCAK